MEIGAQRREKFHRVRRAKILQRSFASCGADAGRCAATDVRHHESKCYRNGARASSAPKNKKAGATIAAPALVE
jgi:hypothetical protein